MGQRVTQPSNTWVIHRGKYLREIVETEDVELLERYCYFRGTYGLVRQDAIDQGIDLGLLEELLARI